MELAESSSYNDMQSIKRKFFALRNGVIADALRRSGCPFRIIFGLNLPQISDIAKALGKNTSLAEKLWANTTARESMLLAPMIVNDSNFAFEDALEWIKSIPAYEVADVMCLKLLRHQDYALQLAERLAVDNNPIWRYTGVRLMFNLVNDYTHEALEYAKRALAKETDGHCRNVAKQLLNECKFILEVEE